MQKQMQLDNIFIDNESCYWDMPQILIQHQQSNKSSSKFSEKIDQKQVLATKNPQQQIIGSHNLCVNSEKMNPQVQAKQLAYRNVLMEDEKKIEQKNRNFPKYILNYFLNYFKDEYNLKEGQKMEFENLRLFLELHHFKSATFKDIVTIFQQSSFHRENRKLLHKVIGEKQIKDKILKSKLLKNKYDYLLCLKMLRIRCHCSKLVARIQITNKKNQ